MRVFDAGEETSVSTALVLPCATECVTVAEASCDDDRLFSPAAIHVEEFNRIEDLQPLRSAWRDLWQQTRGATFFQSLEWLEVYWRHFGQGQQLRVLAVFDEGRPIGILPLVVLTEKTRAGTVRVLTYPLHDWGSFYGPIGPYVTATLLAGLSHIRDTRRDWDLLDLRWVDLSGCDAGRTGRAMEQAGFAARPQAWAQMALVEMSGGWEDYWKSRTKKWRHNVSRLDRRLHEAMPVEYRRYRPRGEAFGESDPRWDLFEACLQLSSRSWQGSSTTGTTLCHDSVCDFLRDVHREAARIGCLDVNLLLLGGRPAAFSYNYYCQKRVAALRMGYDFEFESLGPGTVLQRMILEDSFARGDCQYDFGPGYLDCKRPWQTELGVSYRLTHFRPTSCRAQLLRLKRWVVERIYGSDYVVCSRYNRNPDR